ncbi:MAG: ABC transporter permease [Gemmatimonadetes bacterium]|nr:ABC transporter permease [Gemmatimonadota bacterium]
MAEHAATAGRSAAPSAAASAWLTGTVELRQAAARRRLFGLNVIIPLLLVLPIALGAAPPQHAAAVYAVLFALFGTFGAAIPLLRDAERGWTARLAQTALNARGHLIGRTLAGAALDTAQLAPALLVIATASGAWAVLPALALATACALVFANALGSWVAAAARSVAEGALFAAIACLLLLHASGVFRTPTGSVATTIERFAPFRPLHEVLVAATAGVSSARGSVAASPASALAALLLTTALATYLVRRLAGTGRTG